tara:strand:+ start:635 stop:760 length:126 start_codon:yes stop_codon:yes gene_type:complete
MSGCPDLWWRPLKRRRGNQTFAKRREEIKIELRGVVFKNTA